ncbi:MAG: hypothetical protein ACK4GR_00155 [bacterium]
MKIKRILIYMLIFVVITVFTYSKESYSKESIKIISLIHDQEVSNAISEHIKRYSNSRILSLFDIEYENFDNLKSFDGGLEEEVDVVIVPFTLKKVLEENKTIRYWDDYFRSTPTFFAVFKTYTFDFMKRLSYVDDKVEFLPFFAYSFYHDGNFPGFENLNILEILSVYNSFVSSTDYVMLYSKYLKKFNKDSQLKPLIGNVEGKEVKIFKIEDGFVSMDLPFVMYGIFLTSNPSNVNKVKAIDFIATKIWDFETQIDLALNKGVLASDKNTTLHPGFVQKLKDKSFSLHYNNNLGKIKENFPDYNLFYDVYNIIVKENEAEKVIAYLQEYLYCPLINSEYLYSNYSRLIQKNKAKNYLLGIFENKETKKLIYTPEFIKKNFNILDKSGKKSKITVKDISNLILEGKEDSIKTIEGYKLDSYKKEEMTMVYKRDKEKLIFLRRKTPKYDVIVILN